MTTFDSPRSSMSSILENVSAKDRGLLNNEKLDYDSDGDDDEQKGYQQIGKKPKSRQQSRKRIYLAIGGAATVMILLLVAFATTSYRPDNHNRHGIPLTMDDMRHGIYRPNTQNIRWIDSEVGQEGQYLVNGPNEYYISSWQDRENKTIILKDRTINVGGKDVFVEKLELNKQKTKAILATSGEKNWRHSSFALYWILDIESGEVSAVYKDSADSKLALAKWSPRGDRIAFIYENNLYLRYVGGKDDGMVKQITKDGGAEIFYGRPDWVYEEEVFQGPDAMWWSQSGEYLAFVRTNDSQVPEFPIPYFVPHDNVVDQYPDLVKIKYPKPGKPNPVVSILFLEIESEEYYPVPTESNPVEDDLITEVVWSGDHQVIIRMTNRESDLFKLSLVDAKARIGKVVRTQDLKTTGWFEVTRNMKYVPKDDSNNRPEDGYIDTVIVDGYDHLAYFSPLDASAPKAILTKGNWEVVDAPSAIDLSTNTVYYLSTEKSPVERQLYSVRLDGSDKKPVTDVESDGYYKVSFSSDARFSLLTYSGPSIPWQKVIDLHDPKPVENGVLVENNKKLGEKLEPYATPIVVHSQIYLGEDDQTKKPIYGNAMEFLPANFDKTKKYPVLFHVYGGPVSQTVDKQFNLDFQTIITSKDIIVVTVDGRGTGFMGRQFRAVVRDNLGHFEAQDQIAAAKNWANRSYVDKDRLAIWGWSYGGYMTLKTLETDAGQTFKYGMAVAPVTDWRFYDSIYTERYMHTPQHNPEGYDQARIKNVTAVSQNERFIIMHGTGDDNVHFQNTLVLLDEFDKNGVENYDVHVFPDSDHSIYFHNANSIVYDKLERWIVDAFGGKFKDV